MAIINVLYVDDEPALLDITKIYLERAGELRITTAESVIQGMERLREKQFDIVISDYQMPVNDGISFLKSVRMEFGDLPFILFTGKGREAVVIEALNNGADYYVQKGVDIEAQFTELKHKIKLAVSKRRTELRLNESERRLGEMLEHLDFLSLQLDQNGKISYVNRFAARTLGYSVSELIGRDFFQDFVQTDRVDRQKEMYAKMMENGQMPYNMTAPILTRSGAVRTIHFKNTLIRDERNRIVGMSNLGEDITERLKAEEDRAILAEVVTASAVEFYIFGEDMHFIYANAGAIANLGVTAEEIDVMTLADTRVDYDEAQFRAMLATLVPEEKRMLVYEVEQRRKDGSTYPVEVHLQAYQRNRRRFYIAVCQDITERKKIQSELSMSEARYRSLVDNFYGTVFISDLDSRYPSKVYGQVEELTGYTSADFEQRCVSWMDVVHPDDLHIIMGQIEAVDQDRGRPVTMEYRVVRKDGSIRWVTNNWKVVSLYGNPIIQGTLIDITSIKNVEEELQASNEELQAAEEELRQQLEELTDSEERSRLSEERFHNLFSAMAEGVALHRILLGPDGQPRDYVVLDINPSYEKIIGIRREDIVGKTGTDGYHVASPYLKEFCMPEQTGRPFTFETYFQPMDKHFRISVVRTGKWQFATVFTDNSDAKRLEARLRSQMDDVQALLDIIPGWAFIKDTEGRYLATNRDLLEAMKAKAEDVLGRTDTDVLPQALAERFRRFDAQFLEGSEEELRKVQEGEIGGMRFVHRISMRKLKDDSGKVRGLVAVMLDATETARTKDSLKLANRKLNIMSDITRHDISNKMQVLRGHLELARGDPERAEEHLDKMVRIIGQMERDLQFTRTYQDLGDQDPRWMRLDEVLQPMKEVAIGLELRLDPILHRLEVFADPMLPKVFTNLLDNSQKHGGGVRSVKVTAQRQDELLLIVYEDDGLGIEPDRKEEIFSEALRAGSGHGMIYSKEVLALTGMQIGEEGIQGRGARFVITVPQGHHRIGSESSGVG